MLFLKEHEVCKKMVYRKMGELKRDHDEGKLL
jgi:hypothetical protein